MAALSVTAAEMKTATARTLRLHFVDEDEVIAAAEVEELRSAMKKKRLSRSRQRYNFVLRLTNIISRQLCEAAISIPNNDNRIGLELWKSKLTTESGLNKHFEIRLEATWRHENI
jgi:hypothetical protein